MGSERFDVVYAVDQPTVPMVLTGEWGMSTVSAVVLTRSGILFTVEVPVEVYSPAQSVIISYPFNGPEGERIDYDGYNIWTGSFYAGRSVKLDTRLSARLIDAELDSEGNIINPRNLEVRYVGPSGTHPCLVMPIDEQIQTTTWASSNTAVATVANDGTVTAKAAGTVTISVSVETTQGNTYTNEITIIISVDPDAPAEDPTEPE